VKSSEGIFWEARLRGWERTSFYDFPYDFPKEIFALRGILRRSGTGLLSHFSGNQGGSNATLLPELNEIPSFLPIEDFNQISSVWAKCRKWQAIFSFGTFG
jgi:hypothetical protein